MSSADHARSWWPEMLAEIKIRWTRSYTWEDCARLCKEMSLLRDHIRNSKGIVAATWKSPCSCCGGVMTVAPAKITIRSLLFALNKAGKIDALELAYLDREWTRYQRAMSLDGCGDSKSTSERLEKNF